MGRPSRLSGCAVYGVKGERDVFGLAGLAAVGQEEAA